MKAKVTMALYRQIAIDIAKNIASGKYVQEIGSLVVLCSLPLGFPETIRKALFLLKDVGIYKLKKAAALGLFPLKK